MGLQHINFLNLKFWTVLNSERNSDYNDQLVVRFQFIVLLHYAVSCGQRMATLIGQYSQMTIKLQELAIKANLGLLWYLQTVAIVKATLWLL